jgi:ubiquinone/menaquinone biosynthesis C-methylase UbiE
VVVEEFFRHSNAMSFDTLARHYTWLEYALAGQKLQTCRTVFLDEMRQASSILLAGEGHGRFLPELCRVNQHAQIACVDASAGMLAQARKRLKQPGLCDSRVTYHVTPLSEFRTRDPFDFIVTHFFLDCFGPAELPSIVSHLASLLSPGGRWVVADFQIPQGGWREVRARIVLALAYRFFRLATRLPARKLVSPGPFMLSNGLLRKNRCEFNFGLLYGELWEKGGSSRADAN